MKKKYLFVVPSLSKGGAERVVSILASELVKRNRNAVIVTHFRTEKEYPINNDVEVVCLSNLNETEYREKMSAIYLIKLARKLRKEIVRQNPDYILPFLWTTCVRTDFALMGLSLKERVIQTVRNNPTVFPQNSVMKKYRNRLVQKSRLTIVQKKQQKQYFPEAQWEKIKVLPNPVSLELLQVQRCEDKSQFKVVGVGRLENQKNFDLLIDSVAMVSEKYENIRLEIYGEGSLEKQLQEHIDRINLGRVAFLKGRSSDYNEIYGGASAFVLSSDFEGMPNTLLEAMAIGLPCISTDCPTGPSDIIEDGKNGILVPTGDKNRLEQALEKLIEQNELRLSLSKAAKQTIIMNYTPEKITQRFIEICES